MKISVLSENTALSPEFGHEHGLSLFIQTPKYKILFDAGAGCLFRANAEKLGINLSKIDFAVISHGHYDHGGGLCGLLRNNGAAPIYISPYAFGDYRSRRENGEMAYIGLDINFAFHERLRHVQGRQDIGPDITLFAGGESTYPRPRGNNNLFVYLGSGEYVPDDFRHEQSMILRHEDGYTLVAGCAHHGILNIMERSRLLEGSYPRTVVGGFHLHSSTEEHAPTQQDIRILAQGLLATGSQFYTGHCTGTHGYEALHSIMGSQIKPFFAGSEFSL